MRKPFASSSFFFVHLQNYIFDVLSTTPFYYHKSYQRYSMLARRSISPAAISDVSDASPTGRSTVYERLVHVVPHVHYNINGVAPKDGWKRSTDRPSSGSAEAPVVLIAREVQRLLNAPRSSFLGLGGRLTFSDLDRLLSHFRVDVFGADTVDDIWVVICEVCGFKQAPAFISDVNAIASVIDQYGGKAPAAATKYAGQSRERSMSPTISSARKRIVTEQPHSQRKPNIRTKSPIVFDRLTRDAAYSRERHNDAQRQRDQQRKDEALHECTFTPRISRAHRSGRTHGFDGPTQSSILRAAPCALQTERDELQVTDAVQTPFRRSLPSHVPHQVPVGYVEAVSRLRHGAAERAHSRQSFEETLRNSRAPTTSNADHLTSGTILRIAVPSLGEVVHVRLASPKRR